MSLTKTIILLLPFCALVTRPTRFGKRHVNYSTTTLVKPFHNFFHGHVNNRSYKRELDTYIKSDKDCDAGTAISEAIVKGNIGAEFLEMGLGESERWKEGGGGKRCRGVGDG